MEHRAIFFGTGLGFGIAIKVAAVDHAGGHLEQAGLFFRAHQQLAGAGDDAHGGAAALPVETVAVGPRSHRDMARLLLQALRGDNEARNEMQRLRVQ